LTDNGWLPMCEMALQQSWILLVGRRDLRERADRSAQLAAALAQVPYGD